MGPLRAIEWFQRLAAYSKIDEETSDQQKDKGMQKYNDNDKNVEKRYLFTVDVDKKISSNILMTLLTMKMKMTSM